MIGELLEHLNRAQGRITKMEHQIEDLLRRLYGRSAERLDPNQMVLFADLLKKIQPPAPPAPEAPAAPSASRGHGRRRIPEDLPRTRLLHDLADDEKPCPCCGKMREVIGEETSEQLDYEPARLSVIQHVRLKYACRACEQTAAEGGPQIETAEKPLAPIEKGLAAPGLLAYVIVSKYSDHLPLYRLERILARHKIDLARSTMCDWMRDSAAALKALYDRMVREVLASKVIHTDDTPVDVLDRSRCETRTGRFWVYVGDTAHPYDVFTYTANRSRDGPMNFLADWGKDERRYLQADAFGGYDVIYAGQAGGQVTEVACWAHARRKFYEARTSDSAVATQALAYIRLLYDVEDEAKALFEKESDAAPVGAPAKTDALAKADASRSPAAIRLELRQTKAVPLLAQFKAWLESLLPGGPACEGDLPGAASTTPAGPRSHADSGEAKRSLVLPKSPMGQAIGYVLNQWNALNVYATDGNLAIDNNAAENALRRIAIGRKNWLFCGSDNGGHTAAVLFSLIASCARHEVDPFAYLRDVLTRIAAHPISRLAELLPDRWTPAAPSHA
jgi:transposase